MAPSSEVAGLNKGVGSGEGVGSGVLDGLLAVRLSFGKDVVDIAKRDQLSVQGNN